MVTNIIFGGIIPFVLLIVAGYLIKTFRDDNIVKWVKVAVEAAEQIFEHGMNDKKFAYVSDWISKKFKISEDDLKNIIESAVYELNKKQDNG